MSKKIFVGNYKGGVGKTTSVFALAKYLGLNMPDKRILMIDLDPQSSLSEICISAYRNTMSLSDLSDDETLNSVYHLYNEFFDKNLKIGLTFNTEKLIKTIPSTNVSFIPTSIYYNESMGLDEIAMNMHKKQIENLFILKDFLVNTNIEKDYEYILIDCPPSNNIITQGAFMLSDYYIIPTIMDGVSIKGVSHYIKTINSVYNKYMGSEYKVTIRHHFEKKPELLGVFQTLKRGQVGYEDPIDFCKVTIRGLENITCKNPEIVFETKIDNYIATARSIYDGRIESEEYNSLAREIISLL